MNEEKLGKGARVLPPSPFDTSLEGIARKRAIAKALMEQGLAGPGEDARSYTQLFGSLAQAWAGKSLDKDADKESQGIYAKQNEAYQGDQAALGRVAAALQENLPPDLQDLTIVTTSRYIDRDHPVIKSVFERGDKQFEYQSQGEIIPVLGEDGKQHPARMDKTGRGLVPLDGYQGRVSMPDPKGFALSSGGEQYSQSFGQPTGRVFWDPDSVANLNPNNPKQVLRNEPAISAKVEIAEAGKPTMDVKTQVNNADEAAKIAMTTLGTSRDAAAAASQAKPTLDRIRGLLDDQRFASGPFTGLTMGLSRGLGLNSTQVQETRGAMQGLAQLVLDSRQSLKGQGAISNFEQELLQRAVSDDIDKMSPPEIKRVVDIIEQKHRYIMDEHERLLGASESIQGIDQYRPMFTVPNPYKQKPGGKTGGPAPRTNERRSRIENIRKRLGLVK